MFTFNAVCDRLGVHRQTLEKHQRRGTLKPDVQLENGDRFYKEETVEKFEKTWRSGMATIDEIATLVAVRENKVRYAILRVHKIKPDARRGQAFVYGANKIMMIARTKGWIHVMGESRIYDTWLYAVKVVESGENRIWQVEDDMLTDIGRCGDDVNEALKEKAEEILAIEQKSLSPANLLR